MDSPSPERCPHCQQSTPPNEFAALGAEDLHFLRVFVQSEGKVREMESALGLSYPTIRTRITELKNKIFNQASLPTPAVQTIEGVLEQLDRKEIEFEEAMKMIKKLKAKMPKKGQKS